MLKKLHYKLSRNLQCRSQDILPDVEDIMRQVDEENRITSEISINIESTTKEKNQSNSEQTEQSEAQTIDYNSMDIKEIKAIYKEKTGKNPFGGWDKETLISKL